MATKAGGLADIFTQLMRENDLFTLRKEDAVLTTF